MRKLANFDRPNGYKMILKDVYCDDVYYGLDEFECRYLNILQIKFRSRKSLFIIPSRVKMDLVPYEWNEQHQMYVVNELARRPVSLNRLEKFLIINYAMAKV
ncbi:MAG: hypothetical protein MI922_04410 [Bacteroidales bacterium]|nr:hypothetical protein [Bacteroidales bacterium]